MGLDLCQVKQAAKPYFIENISTNIYSIEELCYYLYENVFLIDDTIVNEVLCDWIRDELGLKKLYRVLYEHLDKQDGTANFIMPLFREIGYLAPEQMRAFQEQLGRLEVQPEDTRQKLKGDYLVRCGMYANAVNEYFQILERQSPGSLGAQFYAGIWNNLGCAFARMFRFEDAANCFLEAWKLTRTREMLRKYVSTLPLYLEDAQYRARMKELGADPQLAERIQEYNLRICEKAGAENEKRHKEEPDPAEHLAFLKEEYRRCNG